jgi:hypothetical protein
VLLASLSTCFGDVPTIDAEESEEVMSVKAVMDALLESGWQVVKRGFDERDFRSWAHSAEEGLNAIFGINNMYTLHFQRLINQPSRRSFFAGALLLGQIRHTVGAVDRNDSNDAA